METENKQTSNRKIHVGLLLILMLAVSMFVLTFPHIQSTGEKTVNIGFGLVPPPAYALADPSDPDFGVPLSTASIGLFAYYYRVSGFILNTTVPAWQSYTDHGSYYDGYVRVWEDVTGNTYAGSDQYVDVSCRLRSDGWILTWLNTTQDRGFIPYWGHIRAASGNPVINATTVMRAMERVYYSGSLTFPGYTNIKMYDYQYSTATKLVVFGRTLTGGGTGLVYWYATIPSSTNTAIVEAMASIGSFGSASSVYNYFAVNDVTKVSWVGTYGWTATDITSSLAFDAAEKFTLAIFPASIYFNNIAVMVWLN